MTPGEKISLVAGIGSLLAGIAAAGSLWIAICTFSETNDVRRAQIISDLSDKVGKTLAVNENEGIDVDRTLSSMFLLYQYSKFNLIEQGVYDYYTARFRKYAKADKFKGAWKIRKGDYEEGFRKYIEELQE